MRDRSLLGALLLIGLVVPLTSCNSSPSLTSIQITPNSISLVDGASVHFTAIGSYTHPNHPAVTRDITSQVTWSSDAPQVATVSTAGVCTGVGIGTIQVSARMQGFNGLISASADVSVTAPVVGTGVSGDITSVAIIPSSQTVKSLNQTSQFIAIGSTASGATFDLTDQVLWNSSNLGVATITNTGLATALSAGTTTITAIAGNIDGTVATGTATFIVAPAGSPEPLVSLSVVPSAQTALAVGQAVQYLAIGTTGAGTTEDLTNSAAWTSTNASIATISGTGLATATGPGSTAILAEITNPDGSVVTGSASLTVTIPTTQEEYVSVVIVPSTQTMLAGQTSQFLAIATTGTGSTVDVTATATWRSSVVAVATINASGGLATGVSTGTTAITAEVTNPDGTSVTGVSLLTVQ